MSEEKTNARKSYHWSKNSETSTTEQEEEGEKSEKKVVAEVEDEEEEKSEKKVVVEEEEEEGEEKTEKKVVVEEEEDEEEEKTEKKVVVEAEDKEGEEEEEEEEEKSKKEVVEEEKEEKEEKVEEETELHPTTKPPFIPENIANEEDDQDEKVEFVTTPPPDFEILDMRIDIRENNVMVTPTFVTERLRFFCTLNLKGMNKPDKERMMYRVTMSGQNLENVRGKRVLRLVTADIHTVESVSCIGRYRNTFFGPRDVPVSVEAPPAPEIQVRIVEQTPMSLEVNVRSSMESRIWCKLSKTTPTNLSPEWVKTGINRFVRSRVSLQLSGLEPATVYQVWCYAESKAGIPMEASLDDVKIQSSTLEGKLMMVMVNDEHHFNSSLTI